MSLGQLLHMLSWRHTESFSQSIYKQGQFPLGCQLSLAYGVVDEVVQNGLLHK